MIEVQGKITGDDPIVIADVELYWRGARIIATRRNTFMLVTAERHLIEIDPEQVPAPSSHDMESFEGSWSRIRTTMGAELLFFDDEEPGPDEPVSLQRRLILEGEKVRVSGAVSRRGLQPNAPRSYRAWAATNVAAITAEKVEAIRINFSTITVSRSR